MPRSDPHSARPVYRQRPAQAPYLKSAQPVSPVTPLEEPGPGLPWAPHPL